MEKHQNISEVVEAAILILSKPRGFWGMFSNGIPAAVRRAFKDWKDIPAEALSLTVHDVSAITATVMQALYERHGIKTTDQNLRDAIAYQVMAVISLARSVKKIDPPARKRDITSLLGHTEPDTRV